MVVMQQTLSAGACFPCPLIANTYSYHIVQAIHLHNCVKSYKRQLGSHLKCSYSVMTDLALLEDSANHALCRERVFKVKSSQVKSPLFM